MSPSGSRPPLLLLLHSDLTHFPQPGLDAWRGGGGGGRPRAPPRGQLPRGKLSELSGPYRYKVSESLLGPSQLCCP